MATLAAFLSLYINSQMVTALKHQSGSTQSLGRGNESFVLASCCLFFLLLSVLVFCASEADGGANGFFYRAFDDPVFESDVQYFGLHIDRTSRGRFVAFMGSPFLPVLVLCPSFVLILPFNITPCPTFSLVFVSFVTPSYQSVFLLVSTIFVLSFGVFSPECLLRLHHLSYPPHLLLLPSSGTRR